MAISPLYKMRSYWMDLLFRPTRKKVIVGVATAAAAGMLWGGYAVLKNDPSTTSNLPQSKIQEVQKKSQRNFLNKSYVMSIGDNFHIEFLADSQKGNFGKYYFLNEKDPAGKQTLTIFGKNVQIYDTYSEKVIDIITNEYIKDFFRTIFFGGAINVEGKKIVDMQTAFQLYDGFLKNPLSSNFSINKDIVGYVVVYDKTRSFILIPESVYKKYIDMKVFANSNGKNAVYQQEYKWLAGFFQYSYDDIVKHVEVLKANIQSINNADPAAVEIKQLMLNVAKSYERFQKFEGFKKDLESLSSENTQNLVEEQIKSASKDLISELDNLYKTIENKINSSNDPDTKQKLQKELVNIKSLLVKLAEVIK